MNSDPPATGADASASSACPDGRAASGVLVTQADGFVTCLLTRAERGNALAADTVAAMTAAFGEATARADVHTVIFAGAGRNFCTGFDLSDLATQSDADLLLRFVRVEMLLAAVHDAPVRTVAYAQGKAWGAGADLFAACDIRVAHAGASFRFPGPAFGLILGTRRLAERVGVDEARRLVTQGATIDGSAAARAGLATECTDHEFADLARRLAAPSVDRATLAALHAASRRAGSDGDLAALVRSAARPGLAARIRAYRAA